MNKHHCKRQRFAIAFMPIQVVFTQKKPQQRFRKKLHQNHAFLAAIITTTTTKTQRKT